MGAIVYLKIVDSTPNKATMRRVSEMSNIYNPNKYTYPCYHLKRKMLYEEALKENLDYKICHSWYW